MDNWQHWPNGQLAMLSFNMPSWLLTVTQFHQFPFLKLFWALKRRFFDPRNSSSAVLAPTLLVVVYLVAISCSDHVTWQLPTNKKTWHEDMGTCWFLRVLDLSCYYCDLFGGDSYIEKKCVVFPTAWFWLTGMGTPPKTNMEPENGPLEKENPFGNHPFQVPC